jgi:AAA family ATP:ADP antiporter
MFAMGVLSSATGFLATGKVIQRYSWTAAALVPTVIVAGSGILFFNFLIFPNGHFSWLYQLLQMSPLMLCVTLGSIQNCLSRASKYTFFDATKEIAFIPLSAESKLKGKAAIDGVGSRLGKSGGAAIHQGLILICSSVASSVPYVAAIFCIVAIAWGVAVMYLGKRFDEIAKPKHV